MTSMKRAYWCADTHCLTCGSYLGELIGLGKLLEGTVAFQPVGGTGRILIEDWRRLRCSRCGGHPYIEQADASSSETLTRALSLDVFVAAA